MSRTLFLYIFKDLLRIFLMTSAALAGIMSFGGLLRPLTEHGLDAAQAAKMLSYFMPAMATYSLPIAALFATTVVYGRLAADNELTACRAAGISYRSIGMPAMVLGLTVALISLLFLCFIVPVFTLKVERVIYSNLAELIANRIERTHQIKFKNGKQEITIFAQEAVVAEPDPNRPDEQVVTLSGLMIVSYEKADSVTPKSDKLQVPREFYLAKQATVFIRRAKHDEFTLEARLDPPGGAMFPRRFEGGQGMQGGIEQTHFGPIPIDSPIREQTKFMDIRRLHELYLDLGQSRQVQKEVQNIVRSAQEARYLESIAAALSKPGGMFTFRSSTEQYDLTSPDGAVVMRNGRLVVTPARLALTRDGRNDFTWDAAEIELAAKPLPDNMLSVQVQLRDVKAETPEGPTGSKGFARNITVPMPTDLKGLANHDIDFYRKAAGVSPDERLALQRELLRTGNGIQSEIHSRISFAVSCLILVIVGCCLGMMFKSGNFLTAFALSVIPALLCIALIVAGQHTCENVPWKISASFQNPLNIGLVLIWSGNAVVLALAIMLGWKVQRQ